MSSASHQLQLRLLPREPSLHFRLGALYHEQGRLREALEKFTRVMALAPESELAKAAAGAVGAIDNLQLQRIALLAAEDRLFGLKLKRDVGATLNEYRLHLSPAAQAMVHMLDFDGLLDAARVPPNATHH